MSCGEGSAPRTHEIAAVPILSRFGLTRPDIDPLPFGDRLAGQVTLGSYTTAAPGWGRALQLFTSVPASALLFSFACFDPPEGGAWITSLAASSDPSFGECRIFTSNQVAEPALAAAGSTIVTARFDNREPAPPIVSRTGHAGPLTAGALLVSVLPRPIWWQGTALCIGGAAINEALQVHIALEMPFQGARRAE